MYVTDLKSDFYDKVIHSRGPQQTRVLILVNFDVDAVCAAKILQYLFQCDHVTYALVPIQGKTDLLKAYQANSSGCKYILLLNCGGTVDLSDFLDPDDDKVFFVADSHRPIEVTNVYNDGQVRLLMKQEEEEGIPDFDDIFKDTDDESDDEEDEETGEKRPRFDETRIMKRRDRRIWEEKRRKILFEYQQFSFYGRSTAVLMYELAWKLSRDTNDLLWWAIVGQTEQFITMKTETESFVLETGNIRDHVSRLNLHGGGDNESVGTMKLSFDKELNLNLYRHWTIFDSLCHSIYTASKFKIWTAKGRNRLSEFLVDLGLPIVQSKQKFSTMDLGLRNEITSMMEEKAEKYNLDEISYGSFTANFGYRNTFCASDIVFSTLALMETEGLMTALESLSRSQKESLDKGIKEAKDQLKTIMGQVQTFLDLRIIVPAGPFLYAIIQDGSPNSRLFSNPNLLLLLAQFTLRAYVAVTPSKKAQQLPLVVSAPLDISQGTCLVLGVPPITDRSRKNLLGKAFEQAAKKTNSRYLLDYFDASVIQLKREDRSKFFDGLISLLS